MAFLSYIGDYRDIFTAAGCKAPTLPVEEDWIYWNTDDPRILSLSRRDVHKPPLNAYVGRFNTSLIRCPADKEILKREAAPGLLPYLFSYTVNSLYVNNENRGLASLYSGDAGWGDQSVKHFKASMIRNPSAKLMLVEEYFSEAQRLPDDARWTPTGADPASIGLDHARAPARQCRAHRVPCRGTSPVDRGRGGAATTSRRAYS